MKKRNSNELELRIWMLRSGVTQKEIVKATGLSFTYICRTVQGTRNCREALRYLLDKGCPAELLDLPKDMREAA